jgi:hypothetical protein
MEQARRRKDVGTINVRFWHKADIPMRRPNVR